MAKKNVYEIVTERLIARIESGDIPWRKPWKGGLAGIPRNADTGRPYSGVNVWLLPQMPDPYWLTFNQAKKNGGSVRKGEKGEMVIFFKRYEKENGAGETERRFVLRYYTVFNVAQCDGIAKLLGKRRAETEGETPSADADPIASAETVLNGYVGGEYGPALGNSDSGRAYYSPALDTINVPPLETFETPEFYYSTAYHEIGHSTGHRNRLARDSVVNHGAFASHSHSREELVAEFCASFLCAQSGIDREPLTENSVAYLQSWIRHLTSDPRAIVTAASQGEKAARWILGERSVQTEASAAA